MVSKRRFGSRSTADEVLQGIDLSTRRILVTGANAGIGYEAARSFAKAGAEVVVACRTPETAATTVARIQNAHPRARLVPAALDLGSFASIVTATERLADVPLHALVCNAGLYGAYAETRDGIEQTVGVCHAGHALLTLRLLGALERAAPARVVMVSSESHRAPARLDFDRFPMKREKYRPLIAYGQAKLCNVLFANELTRRHGARGIFANSLHPGNLIRTSIGRNSGAAAALLWLAQPFTKSVAQGAATTAFCAAAPELEGVGGRYYQDCREKTASEDARDPATAARLWEITDRWLAPAMSGGAVTPA